jgi:hypothetical protein
MSVVPRRDLPETSLLGSDSWATPHHLSTPATLTRNTPLLHHVWFGLQKRRKDWGRLLREALRGVSSPIDKDNPDQV